MIGIYMFTNKKNNKKYIGQSTQIEKRHYQHCINSFNQNYKGYNSYFYKAIRKYGIENFTFEILELCEKDQLNEREIYWINYYNSNNIKYGYNLTEGGDNNSNKSKKIYQYDKEGNLIATYKNAYEAATILGPPFYQSNIQQCASHGKSRTVGGFIFEYEGNLPQKYKKGNSVPVIRIDKNGERKEYQSLKEAAADSNTCGSNITAVLKGRRKTAGGYRWEPNLKNN